MKYNFFVSNLEELQKISTNDITLQNFITTWRHLYNAQPPHPKTSHSKNFKLCGKVHVIQKWIKTIKLTILLNKN
jgi:hypothetical protein